MINIYAVASFWFLSALVSTIIANRLKISNALMEIIIGLFAPNGFFLFFSQWVFWLSGQVANQYYQHISLE
jgi:hypothetical protein